MKLGLVMALWVALLRKVGMGIASLRTLVYEMSLNVKVGATRYSHGVDGPRSGFSFHSELDVEQY